MKKSSVTSLVRATECSYAKEPCTAAGVAVEDMAYADGEPPPEAIITRWLALCTKTFAKKDKGSAIAVHCVAGLGRAPVLVALALIERGMEPLDAVKLIREKRRGAINAKQVRPPQAAAPAPRAPSRLTPRAAPHLHPTHTHSAPPQLQYIEYTYKRRGPQGGCAVM
jgi:hypothetical protein